MIAIARGSITEPDKLGPLIDDEMLVVEQLKAEGMIKALYRRAASPGVVIVLEGQSVDAMKERMNTHPLRSPGTHDPGIRRGLRDLRRLTGRRRDKPATPARAVTRKGMMAS